ncbi:fumarylacetoacetate hydrolase family protein [Garicola koreensis]|uniref:2-keto-4-pentenoate hydratase/2-oxohepta-3-ene-1,7-dioic acid hydratase in catechol pathway n=1 Tax=Garicola koreensis TaxID=1262554 RepID=A0A7W5TRJ8_9MICC|nr:fumarylacetoacetate hydrolase family protein [Garicola koreensis]MBB3667332.1 2-keto-4-pentenoate hydratase/2-oxohepta-3-ene-1,7-dioic acid hydratase in catechol pathway [Garicola koreensis]
MKICRFVTDAEPAYGILAGAEGEESIIELVGDPFYQGIKESGQTHKLDDVRLVAPIIPRSKLIGVGRNYLDHAKEMGNDAPASPLLFLMPNTAVVGPNEPVTMPAFSEEVSYEAELAVVIGRICKDVPLDRVSEVIYGYTVANDVTARDAQRTDGQWARAKGFDTSVPLGPWIETQLDSEDLRVTGRLNGETVQDGSTADMIFGVAELVNYISQAMTLLPGDVILTGTPAGVGQVTEGDRFEAEVEGIGTLTNFFRS